MSIALDEIFELISQEQLPKDILKQLDELEDGVLPDEEETLARLMEGVMLRIKDTAK